jgi:hypothetical protein
LLTAPVCARNVRWSNGVESVRNLMVEFSVVQKVFSPTGAQLDSDSIAEYASEAEANAHIERLYKDQGPVAERIAIGENYCSWYVLS